LYPEEFSEIALGDSTAQATPKGRPLSGRETTVVKLVAEGHTNRQIAQILHISLKTVETYRATAMRKLHLSSAAHLVRYAVRYGLIEP
jgi:DNA-binding CsgD family transcriptional regulator